MLPFSFCNIQYFLARTGNNEIVETLKRQTACYLNRRSPSGEKIYRRQVVISLTLAIGRLSPEPVSSIPFY